MRSSWLHRSLASWIVIGLALALAPSTAGAAGFGAYFEYGRDFTAGGGDLGTFADLTPNPSATLDLFDRNEFGVGLAIDTNLARDRLFNYRTDLGFHVTEFANQNVVNTLGAAGIGNGYGFMWNNAFGFGVVRTENIRFWMGPAFRLNVDYYSNSISSVGDLVDAQVGVGPEIGLNVHLGQHMTATLSMAYNYKWGWYALPNATNFNAINGNPTLSHTDNYLSVNLAFFFRTAGDQF